MKKEKDTIGGGIKRQQRRVARSQVKSRPLFLFFHTEWDVYLVVEGLARFEMNSFGEWAVEAVSYASTRR